MKNEILSDRLIARRKELGLTQQQVADKVSKSRVKVFKQENDRREPKGKALFTLSQALKCSPTWLLFGDEDQSPLAAVRLPVKLDDRKKRLP